MDVAPTVDPSGIERLSPREAQVLGLAADGLLDKQIAANLGVTENTMRTYWRRIRTKVGEAPRGALAALYARSKVDGSPVEDGVEWSIDVPRGVVVYRGERGFLPLGETGLEKAIDVYHPADRERIRRLIQAMVERDMPPVTYMARVVTPYGVETTSSVMRPVRDKDGRVVRIEGRHVPILDLTAETDGAGNVGFYRRDFDTGTVEVDEGLAAIFRVHRDDPQLFEAIQAKFCPEFRPRMRNLVGGMIAAGHAQRRWTARLCFEKGESLWVSSQSRLEEENGRPCAFVATVVAYR